MKGSTLWLVVVVAMVWSVGGELEPPEREYKFLMLLPFCSRSHRNVFMALAEGLVERGHKVDMLTAYPPSSKNPNIREVTHELPYINPSAVNMFEERKQGPGGLGFFKRILPQMARDMYKVPVVKELYDKRKEYDLIIVNHMFNEVAYPFVHNSTFITIATPGMDPRHSAVLGNVLNPSYIPNLMISYPFPMSVWERVKNTVLHIFIAFFWRSWAVVPLIQEEISAQFPDLPPLLDIERNQSLALLNTHFSISSAKPLLPSQVEVGAMHCRPAKPLPKDLEEWISGGGEKGVIYFSLGSVARGESIPEEYRNLFIEAFRRLPQRVLWKYEGELKDKPSNIKISNWLPQQDILAHKNVRVFISHGGLLSMQESIYHATPLLVLPIFGDQPRNGKFVANEGLGRELVWEELTADIIVEAITDIISNTKYQKKLSAMSSSLRDQPASPQETAVFWTEYVIRHSGAPQLRCPATQLSWVEFLLLDVLGLFVLALIVVLVVLWRVLRLVTGTLSGSDGGGSNKRKKE